MLPAAHLDHRGSVVVLRGRSSSASSGGPSVGGEPRTSAGVDPASAQSSCATKSATAAAYSGASSGSRWLAFSNRCSTGLRQPLLQVPQVLFQEDRVPRPPEQQRRDVEPGDAVGDPVERRPAGMTCSERDVGNELADRPRGVRRCR